MNTTTAVVVTEEEFAEAVCQSGRVYNTILIGKTDFDIELHWFFAEMEEEFGWVEVYARANNVSSYATTETKKMKLLKAIPGELKKTLEERGFTLPENAKLDIELCFDGEYSLEYLRTTGVYLRTKDGVVCH